MTGRRTPPGLSGFRRAAGGAVAVEFAFISTILLLMIVGGFDLTRAIAAKRDTARAAAELSNSMAQCPTSSCVYNAGSAEMASPVNTFPDIPGATISWAMVSNLNGQLIVDFGNIEVLPSDVKSSALSMLNSNDNGVCVIVSYDAGVADAPASWGNFDQSRAFTCNVQSRQVKMAS